MHTFDYDFGYSPSFPAVKLSVKPFEQNRDFIFLDALLDSGADGTLIPIKELRQMRARKTGQTILRSITGATSIVDIYEVTIQLGPHLFPKVRVAADKHNQMTIVRRDILNQIIITLNGLASTTEIHE